ncbi:hypothetical protein J0695_28320 [Streptomyces beijiangensis]|uniref:Uncharacterized protein n=1 Tax=Streptomyces beijiangensis TaxID=163361 RepID=A0A939FBP7_9ACTN|nr:hypothetical protein [Streptomyces beijiangensis]
MLCAGTYLDSDYRDAVIDELYVHEERIVAPSLGFDASRVLAHALRARRIELGWAGAILGLWIVALPLTQWLVLFYVLPVVFLAVAPRVRGTATHPNWYRLVGGWALRWYGRLLFLWVLVFLLAVALSDDGALSNTGDPSSFMPIFEFATEKILRAGKLQAWIALSLPLVLAWAVAMQRGQFARALTAELSKERFRDVAGDPAEQSEGARFQRLRHRIRIEQHAPLVMYHAADPFCGAGTPYATWSLSIELRPSGDADKKPEPLDNSAILRRIVPLLEALREPSPHGAPHVAAAVRDRLRELEIEEIVFLPVDGLPNRTHAPYAVEAFEEHRARSVEEGGETRRHFLRIRVGGWSEEIVATVFVRVHTQGGMLMLEVAPHVLRPVRPLFQYADRVAYRYRHNNHFGKAVWALSRTPSSAGNAIVTLARGLASVWRMATSGNAKALADGPGLSVRELGSDDAASLFQDMDLSRYLKSVQDRVTSGVQLALKDAGYRTEEFEQKIVNVANGGTFIETAKGAVGIGNNNTITNNSTTQTGGGARGNN